MFCSYIWNCLRLSPQKSDYCSCVILKEKRPAVFSYCWEIVTLAKCHLFCLLFLGPKILTHEFKGTCCKEKHVRPSNHTKVIPSVKVLHLYRGPTWCFAMCHVTFYDATHCTVLICWKFSKAGIWYASVVQSKTKGYMDMPPLFLIVNLIF